MSDYIVVVRTFQDEMAARIAQAVLSSEGIRSILIPDNAGGMLPSMQLLFPTRLAVHEDDLVDARRVLDRPPQPDEDADADGDADVVAEESDADDE